MTEYPTEANARAAVRLARAQQWHDMAERSARVGYSSSKCADYHWHAGEPNGCTNDAERCLCECHDQAEEKP